MSIFSFIFGRSEKAEKKQPSSVLHTKFINEPTANFSIWNGSPNQNDIAIACIDAICRNISKLKGSHAIDGKPVENRLTRLLQVRPNAVQSASDFLYKVSAIYYLNNNAFVLIDRDELGNVSGLYPVDYTSAQFMQDESGTIYVEFVLKDGKKSLLPYSDLVHMRRHYTTNRLTGSDNQAIQPALELAQVQNEGLVNSIQSAANIRGVLKFSGVAGEKKVLAAKEQFKQNFFTVENDGGVIVIDKNAEFIPLDMKPVILDEGQSKQIREKVFSYYGVTEAIVTSDYTEDQFAAFYESVIEPFALQLSLEMTAKVFTEREVAFGNRVLYESGRLQFSSNKTKVELIKELMPTGLLTVNQCLEILNLPTVQDGDRRLQSLNYIDQAKATEYQLAKAGAGGHEDNHEETHENNTKGQQI